ncbi:MAG: hypothetical protein IPJ77_21915 [Planctomycetes bacterium]|nr:hypothetical protein [Planctomycetota bacterium]
MLSALFLSFALQTPKLVTEIQARLPETPFVVSVRLSDWNGEAAVADALRGALGDKVLLAGEIAPKGSILSLIAERNEPAVSPQTWRERLAPPGERFDVEFTPCVDSTQSLPGGFVQSDFHAYYATRTHAFDLHVSRLVEKGGEPFPKAEFDRIVRSIRVLLLRRGWAEDYPDDIDVPMTLAAVLGVESPPWKASYLKKHAEEWGTNFSHAEFLHYVKAPVDEQVAAYQKTLALFAKLEKPGPKERFAWAMACDGLGLALYDGKRYAETVAPLEKGLALLTELGKKERAGLAYNLACSHALLKHEREALAALRTAIEADSSYRATAAKDTDFDSVRGSVLFRELVSAPAGTTPTPR